MESDGGFDGGAKVVPEVEAVGHLDRVRCTGPGAVGVGADSVTTDDLGAGMLAQPAREGRGVPARQQVERSAVRSVDEDSAVVVPATGGEVIDAQHLWNGPERIRHGRDCPQQRSPTRLRLQDDSYQTGPAWPARATATTARTRRDTGVLPPYLNVRPATCSTNARRPHRLLSQYSRRTLSAITTGWSPTGLSSSRRS